MTGEPRAREAAAPLFWLLQAVGSPGHGRHARRVIVLDSPVGGEGMCRAAGI